jgi:hypothetical protein
MLNRFTLQSGLDVVNEDELDKWIDCWVGCANVLVYNGTKVNLKACSPDVRR